MAATGKVCILLLYYTETKLNIVIVERPCSTPGFPHKNAPFNELSAV